MLVVYSPREAYPITMDLEVRLRMASTMFTYPSGYQRGLESPATVTVSTLGTWIIHVYVIMLKAFQEVKSFHKKTTSKGDGASLKQMIDTLNLLHGHPNCIKFIALGEDDEFIHLRYQISKFAQPLPSHTLRRLRVDESGSLVILAQIGAVLSHMHEKGYAHRGLRPESIYMNTR